MSYPVMNQPAGGMGGQVNVGPRDWSSGICDCTNDFGSCILGTFLPIVLAFRVASDAGENCCVPCFVPGGMTAVRTKMRTQHNIQGSICDDCITITFCAHCIYCQMAREQDYLRQMGQG